MGASSISTKKGIAPNTGHGDAIDVQFKANREIPARAFGIEGAAAPESMRDGPLICGIPSFGRGEKRIITWGNYWGLRNGLGDEVLDVTAVYFSMPPLRIRRQKHKTTSRIDIRSFKGTDSSDRNWEKKSAEQLEKIANTLSKLTDVSQEAFKVLINSESKNGEI